MTHVAGDLGVERFKVGNRGPNMVLYDEVCGDRTEWLFGELERESAGEFACINEVRGEEHGPICQWT